jgi:hypothetical protein
MPKSSSRSWNRRGTMAVARSSVSAGSPHQVGRCVRRSRRSSRLHSYQPVSFCFFTKRSVTDGPATWRR